MAHKKIQNLASVLHDKKTLSAQVITIPVILISFPPESSKIGSASQRRTIHVCRKEKREKILPPPPLSFFRENGSPPSADGDCNLDLCPVIALWELPRDEERRGGGVTTSTWNRISCSIITLK